MRLLHLLSTIAALAALAQPAAASALLYHGLNPAINPLASPINGPNLTTDRDLTRPHNDPHSSTASSNTLNESDLLKRSVISGLSTHYQQLLTSNDPNAGGQVNFGDGSYAVYSTNGGVRSITFYNGDGTQTQISFPI